MAARKTRLFALAALMGSVGVGYFGWRALPGRVATNSGGLAASAEGRMKDPDSFRRIPQELTVRLSVIAQEQQRYDTVGDWLWRGNLLEIRVSREAGGKDPRYTTLLFVHELIEALLCRSAGVTAAQVDAFDMSHQEEVEPGDNPAAPYHRQHVAAEAAERALAEQLEVNWDGYLARQRQAF